MKREILQDRAQMLEQARKFFKEREFLEIDCPAIIKHANIDLNIEPIKCFPYGNKKAFLHTSPEYFLKRLLAEGLDKIYFLGHVFRKDEVGHKHNLEFTMAEWYQKNTTFEHFLKEVLNFLVLFLGEKTWEIASYREVFQRYAGVDYLKTSDQELLKLISQYLSSAQVYDRSTLLDLILTHIIEPQLGMDSFFVLNDYPASQAALAATCIKNGEEVAERFEIYHKGVELANGYHELNSSKTQKKRFLEMSQERKKAKKSSFALDKEFLRALDNIGDCFGVSVGIDRLLMLKHNASSIAEVFPFSWENQ